jgi:hypothetical protein
VNLRKINFFKRKAFFSLKIYKSDFFVFSMEREVKFKHVFLILVLVLALQGVFAETETMLDIANTPPELIKEIPNQSWQSNTVLENAFELDDYFEDPEGEPMSYSYSNLTNITITISENNSVSFFPEEDFIGEEIVQFYADDGTHVGISNWVHLNVGVDTQPPEWFDAKKDKPKVYQNDYVTFNVTWTDNFELMNYTFYINQERVWTEKKGSLNGSKDYSTPKVQISSPAGKIVQWKICASDTSLNTACTDVFEFDVLVKPENPPSSGEEPGEESETEEELVRERPIYDAVKDLFDTTEKPDFSFNVNSFLVNLKQGTGSTKILEITNTGTSELEFELFLEELGEFVELSETVFNLSAGRTKRITIDFRAMLNSEPGEYFGVLVVQSFKKATLPIYLTIDEINIDFGVNVEVLEESKVVNPGKEVVAKIDLKNLKDQVPVDAVLYYAVKDFNGEIYNFKEDNVTFDSTLSLEKSLEIPETTSIGNYVFYVRVYNQKDSAIYSDDFQVGQRFQFAALIRASSVFILIFLFSFILFFFVIRYKRQKERGRILNLYVKLNEMKELIKKNKFDEAAKAYIGIKRIYGERVSPELLENKEKLVEAIKELSKKIDFDVNKATKKTEGGNENSEGEESKSDRDEDQESLEEDKSEKKESKGKEGEEKKKDEKDKKEKSSSEEIEKKSEKKVLQNKGKVIKKTNKISGEKKIVKPVSNEREKIKKKPLIKKKIIEKKEEIGNKKIVGKEKVIPKVEKKKEIEKSEDLKVKEKNDENKVDKKEENKNEKSSSEENNKMENREKIKENKIGNKKDEEGEEGNEKFSEKNEKENKIEDKKEEVKNEN